MNLVFLKICELLNGQLLILDFQKAFGIKFYIHEETLDIGSKVMLVICIQTML